MMLKHLNEANDVTVYSVFDKEFESFGRVLTDFDVSDLSAYLSEKTEIPAQGNIYVASVPEMECLPIARQLQKTVYGEMPIQIGYCNGKNAAYNAFEYHKGSEVNVAVSDLCLVLGHTWQIKDNRFYVGDETVFFVPKGTVIEVYATTLHFSPCRVCDEGFKALVVLPKGTNTPLEQKRENPQGEAALLLQKNKWLLAHPDREPLMKQGAFPGLIGENKEIKY